MILMAEQHMKAYSRRSSATSEKSRIKRNADVPNEIDVLLHRCENRMSPHNVNIAERYIKGDLGIAFAVRANRKSHEGNLLVKRRPNAVMKTKREPTLLDRGFGNEGRPEYEVVSTSREGDLHVGGETATENLGPDIRSMFVYISNATQGPEEVVPSLVGLQLLNEGNCVGRKSSYLSLRTGGIKLLPIAREWEVNALITAAVLSGKSAGQMVENRPQLIDGLADDNGNDPWNLFGLFNRDPFVGINCRIGSHFVDATFMEGLNEFVQFEDVFIGPFEL